MLELLHY